MVKQSVIGASSRLRMLGGVGVVGSMSAVVGFAVLVFLAAQVRVPLPGSPVPMTLQLAAVLLAGYCLRPTVAASAMLVYLAAGLVGLPVFAAGSAGIMGVTGGYLVGFVLSAWLVAVVVRRRPTPFRRLVAGALGTVVVLSLGAAWQMTLFGVEPSVVLSIGIVPFLPKAVIELLLVVSAMQGADALRSRFQQGLRENG
jgi:biotin transport system substrate-specific component